MRKVLRTRLGTFLLLALMGVAMAGPITPILFAVTTPPSKPVVPTLVQSSAAVQWNGNSATIDITLTGVLAGDDIVVTGGYDGFVTGPGSFTCNDGSSYTVEASQTFDGSNAVSEILRLRNVSAGTHTIACTGDAPDADSFGQAMAHEVAGDANVATDQTAVATASSTTPAVGPTGTLGQAQQIVFAVLCADANTSLSGVTSPPNPGYVQLYLDVSDSILPCAFSYQGVNTTTPVGANWGTTATSHSWGAVVATFKGAMQQGGGGGGGSSSSSGGGSSSSSGGGSSSGGLQQVKWHPGHYISSPLLIRIGNTQQIDQSNDAIAFMNTLPSNIVGYQLNIAWSMMECCTKGVYDFSQVDNALNRLGAGRKLIIAIGTGLGSSDASEIIPTYMLSNSSYGASPVGGQYGYWTSFEGGQVDTAIWRPAVGARLDALYQALGARYDSDTRVEGIGSLDESAVGANMDSGDTTFSPAALRTFNQNLYAAALPTMPHTNLLGMQVNFTAGDTSETNAPQSGGLIQDEFTAGAATGWPDTYGNVDDDTTHLSWGQSSFLGLAGPPSGLSSAVNYSGRMPVFGDVQSSCVGAASDSCAPLDYTESPSKIAPWINTKLFITHAVWWYVQATGSGQGDWTAPAPDGVQAAINTNPIQNTGCPSTYLTLRGGCNTL